MKRGTGGTARCVRLVGVVEVESAIAIAAPVDGWSATAEGEIVEKDDDLEAEAEAEVEAEGEAPPFALAGVDAMLLAPMLELNTDTLVFTGETGEGSMNTGG